MTSPTPDDDDRTVIRRQDARTEVIAGPAAAPATAPPAATPAAPGAAPRPDSGNALPEGTTLGEFELRGVIGEGGFGIVYTAYDHSLRRRVALKEYMPASLASRGDSLQVQVRSIRHAETFDAGLKSFVNEARLLAQFDHPSLVKVYRFWEANGTAYMVMPLYEGITLKDKLRQMAQPPDEAWLLALLAPLTEALAVIHAENCFHRDIAPDNVILLAGSERPLLLDFGAARRVIGDMTQALTVVLKPGYAPVEQYAEVPEMKQGAWTDVYALAATVHYAITGKTPPASVGRMMNDGYRPLSVAVAGRYSEPFLRAIDNALRVRPDDRTPSIDALRAELGLPPVEHSATSSAHFTVMPTPTAMATPESTRVAAAGGGSRKGLIVAGVAALALIGAVAAYLLSGRSEPQPVATAPAQAPPATPASPAPAAPAAVLPSGPPPFEVRAEFDKVLAGQAADFKVEAAPKSKQLRIGRDKLSFTVSSSRDGYVQVLVLGPDGTLLLLFPNAQSADNAIKAGQTLTLPQPSWLLDTVEPAGREDFLVVVSAQPRDYSGLSKDYDYIFLKLPIGSRGAELAAGWTRPTPLLIGGLKSCPSADCEAYGAAAFSVTIEH